MFVFSVTLTLGLGFNVWGSGLDNFGVWVLGLQCLGGLGFGHTVFLGLC